MDRTRENVKHGSPWSRDELILAFELYCRIPFSKTKTTNEHVKALAALLHRSPAAVARKLGNFGSFDPALRARNISGLAHTGRLDREIWEKFNDDWGELVVEANRLRACLSPLPEAGEARLPSGPSEKATISKRRVHQAFFRDAVLSSYDHTCCVTGITVGECLVASHIVPWSVDRRLRADPTNGLCLSATFDRLFDAGLMTIADDFRVLLSPHLLRNASRPNHQHLHVFNGRPVRLPTRFAPKQECLEWHRRSVFRA